VLEGSIIISFLNPFVLVLSVFKLSYHDPDTSEDVVTE
jgi:hypothetical protein